MPKKFLLYFIGIFILCLLYMGMFYFASNNGAGILPTSLGIPIDATEYLSFINGLPFDFVILFVVFIMIYIGVNFDQFIKYKSSISSILFVISTFIFIVAFILICVHKSTFISVPEIITVLLVQLLSIIFFKNVLIVCLLFWCCALFSIANLLMNLFKNN